MTTPWKPPLSEFSFASLLVYAKNDQSRIGRAAFRTVQDVKSDGRSVRDPDKRVIVAIAENVAENRETYPFGSILTDSTVLVPIPRSAPLRAGDVWPPMLIAEELHRVGFGTAVEPLIVRVKGVPKSSTSKPGERALSEVHYKSMRLSSGQPRLLSEITLIDDVVTRGRTSLGAAARLRDAYPGVSITLFTVARTCSLVTNMESYIQPFVGRIRFRDGDTNRDD